MAAVSKNLLYGTGKSLCLSDGYVLMTVLAKAYTLKMMEARGFL
ncbi:MAG: hypothetical protein ACOYKJ_06950 [Candidatus Howiella sp.]